MIHFHASLHAAARCVACDRLQELVCYVLKEELERLANERGLVFEEQIGSGFVALTSCPGCARFEPVRRDPLALPEERGDA